MGILKRSYVSLSGKSIFCAILIQYRVKSRVKTMNVETIFVTGISVTSAGPSHSSLTELAIKRMDWCGKRRMKRASAPPA
jgi:hypothetical protein